MIVVALISVAAVLMGFGIWIPNYRSRSAYPVRGIDISHHQGDIRWDQIPLSEVHFAYIKATEGGDFRDNDFGHNWSEAKKAGIAPGAYHFIRWERRVAGKLRILSRPCRSIPRRCHPPLIWRFPVTTERIQRRCRNFNGSSLSSWLLFQLNFENPRSFIPPQIFRKII